MMDQNPVLAIIILFMGAFLVGLVGDRFKLLRNIIVTTVTAGAFVLVAVLFKHIMIDGNIAAYWLGDWKPVSNWAIGIGIEVDQLSYFFGLIVSFIVLLSAIYSFSYMSRDKGLDKYFVIFLMLSGSIMGLVFSGDLFNMFVMIEIMTFSAVGLTAFRNHTPGAIEAAFKYIVIGSIGSSLVLLGTVLVYAQLHTLNLAQIAAQMGSLNQNQEHPLVVWFGIAVIMGGYAVKAFLVPAHIVAPDAYMAAPSSVSMLFSGIVNKAGVYGIIRLMYVVFQSMGMPRMQFLMVFWGTVTMFVGVTMALAQSDFKRLLAFHSISQIGYVITGIGLYSALGAAGGIYHALNHTLFKGLLFLCSGAVLYATGTTDLNKLGGLSKKMPYTTVLFLVGAFSISGLPPFNGFVSKWLIYQATYQQAVVTHNIGYAFVTIVALVVSVMTLASFIKVTQSVFFGQLPKGYENVREVPLLMRIPMTALALLCLIAGILPQVVNNLLIKPVVGAVFNAAKYIDVMMGSGYAEKVYNFTVKPADINYAIAGYQPLSWLLLFGILLAAFTLATLIGNARNEKLVAEFAVTDLTPQEYKTDTFYCGEASEYSHLGGNDLFWGLKYNLRHYFNFMHEAHSGQINDYTLWVISTTAILMIYIFAAVLV